MSLLLLFNSSADIPVVEIPSEITDRPFFAWNNMADTAVLSGGSWTDGLPLNNLKNRKQARVARSTSASPAATQFIIDLGSTKVWRVAALIAHQIGLDGRWRLTASNDPAVASPTYDGGWTKAWPRVHETTAWEDDNFWSGQYTLDEIKGMNATLIHRPPQLRSERYIKIEIDDPLNVQSFVQIGRLFVANGWSPSRGILVGATFGVTDDTEVQRSWSGAEAFTDKRRRREATIELAPLEEAESYGKAFEMMRQAGISGEVLFIWKGTDTTRALQRQFLGRMQRLSPIQHPYPFNQSVAFSLVELL